jgi:hypothetical protein
MTTPLRTISIADPALDVHATQAQRRPEWGVEKWARASREAEHAVLFPGRTPTIFVVASIGLRAWREYVAPSISMGVHEPLLRAFECGVIAIERPGAPVRKPSTSDPFRRWTDAELDDLDVTPAEIEDIGSLAYARGHLGKAWRGLWPLSPSWLSVLTARTDISLPAAETASAPELSAQP